MELVRCTNSRSLEQNSMFQCRYSYLLTVAEISDEEEKRELGKCAVSSAIVETHSDGEGTLLHSTQEKTSITETCTFDSYQHNYHTNGNKEYKADVKTRDIVSKELHCRIVEDEIARVEEKKQADPDSHMKNR